MGEECDVEIAKGLHEISMCGMCLILARVLIRARHLLGLSWKIPSDPDIDP